MRDSLNEILGVRKFQAELNERWRAKNSSALTSIVRRTAAPGSFLPSFPFAGPVHIVYDTKNGYVIMELKR